jgi:hypothetical protein
MKKILIAFMLLGGLGSFLSCYYDDPPEPLPFDCDEVSFTTHIAPILENSCSTTGCHDGTRVPDLRTDVALNKLRSGGYLNTTIPEESSFYKTVDFSQNPMPPGGPQITALNRELILCWISEGAPDN